MMAIWLDAAAKCHESPRQPLSKILKTSANATLSRKNHTALARLGIPSPKFSAIWETEARQLKIVTALIRLQLRPQFGPGHDGASKGVSKIRRAKSAWIQYEGRRYIELKRHMVFSMVSYLFLAQVRQEWGKNPDLTICQLHTALAAVIRSWWMTGESATDRWLDQVAETTIGNLHAAGIYLTQLARCSWNST
jgi:hypothetical protein